MGPLTSSFVRKDRQTLYHAIPCKPHGDAIETSVNYGTSIPPAVCEKLGIPPDEKIPLVFAATRLHKSLAFALPKGERLFNLSIDAANAEIVIAANRQNFMSKPVDATVFSFCGDGFVSLPQLQHQSVSTKPIPFSKTKMALKVGSVEDLMRAGLQIFTFSEDIKALHNDAAVDNLCQTKDDAKIPAALGELIKSGKVIWENQSRGLSPNARLAKMMGMKISRQPQPAV